MSVLISKNKEELIVTCNCGCDEAFHIKVEKFDDDDYAFLTYMNGNFYRDKDDRTLRVICRKLKKIWSIIRNKDFYYGKVVMNKNDYEEFKSYINQYGDKSSNLKNAVNILRDELLKHDDLYEGFISSIRSAITDSENNWEVEQNELAEFILKRIIGDE